MNEDRITGQRAGIRWAIAWLRSVARTMPSADARDVLNSAAWAMLVAAKALRNEDADDITAGLEALSEPIVAEWGEVKDRLGLARDAHTKEQT